MSFHKLDIYDAGRLRLYEHWRIYALFCMRTPTDAVVKIGASSIVYDRLLSLQAGLPFRIGVCLHAPVGERGHTMEVEAALHKAFKERNTRGEWFEFDLADPTAKSEFHDTTKAIYERMVGNPLKWDKITAEQLSAFAAMKKREAEERKAQSKRRWAA